MFAQNHTSASLKRVAWRSILLTILLSLLAFTIALAAPGDLDTTFDGDGLVTSYIAPSNPGRDDLAYGIAIQPNGKIVAAGYSYIPSTAITDFAVTRYNTDGSLDNTFSGDGRLITNFNGTDGATDVAIQSNGKIVVAGLVCQAPTTIGYCDAAVARYTSNGMLDTTFNGDGKQTSDFGGGENGAQGGLAIQSDGKIVVAGYMSNGSDVDFAIYRYNANGSLDTTFSGDGKVNIGFGAGRQDFANDLAIQSDGKITVAGFTGDANNANNNFAIARLNTNGTLDVTFSGDGKQVTNMGADEYGSGLVIQPNGKIVLVGQKRMGDITLPGVQTKFAVVRYNTDGNLDASFNSTGKKIFSVIPGNDSYGQDVIVQVDGKIVLVGSDVSFISGNDFALVRLNSGGSFDSTFSA